MTCSLNANVIKSFNKYSHLHIPVKRNIFSLLSFTLNVATKWKSQYYVVPSSFFMQQRHKIIPLIDELGQLSSSIWLGIYICGNLLPTYTIVAFFLSSYKNLSEQIKSQWNKSHPVFPAFDGIPLFTVTLPCSDWL